MLIIGLGNAGLKYRNTYHNIGFAVADKLAKQLNTRFTHTECKSKTAVCNVNGERVIIAKPTTYMNLSGEAVRELIGKYSASAEDTVIIYDDVDLPVGVVRLRASGSAGTHNGMRNIISLIGRDDFKRVRIGTGFDRGNRPLYDVVLSKIDGENKTILDDAAERAAEAVRDYLTCGDFEAVMRRYSK